MSALVLTSLLYWPTSLEIGDLWQDTVRRRYTHGWLVLTVTLWLIWRDRVQLSSITLAPPVAGWLLVAVGSVGWLVGLNAGLLTVTMLAMPILALSAVWAAGGWFLSRRVAFAILYLYFALPVWDLINPPLQAQTAFVCLWLTRLAGIPAVIDENVIQIQAGSFEIAGGCSGLHFFIVAVAVAALQGHLDRNNIRARCLLIGVAAALALLTNWLRVFVIIVAGHLTDMQHFLVKVDHYYFGWFIFVFALGFYFYLSRWVSKGGNSRPLSVHVAPSRATNRATVMTVLNLAALSVGPVWALARGSNEAEVVTRSPPELEGWSGPMLSLSDWRPFFADPDQEFLVEYHNDSVGDVTLFHALYQSQRQGKELRGYGNSVLGPNYHSLEVRRRYVRTAGYTLPVSEHLASSIHDRQLLVWSVFAVDGRPDDMGLASQLGVGVRALLRFPSVSVVALAAECRPDCDGARAALDAAAIRVLPKLLSLQRTGRPIISTDGAG